MAQTQPTDTVADRTRQLDSVLVVSHRVSSSVKEGKPVQQMDREAMQKQREEQEAKLKAILTEEQYKTWTEAQQNMRRRGPGGPGGRGGGRPHR